MYELKRELIKPIFRCALCGMETPLDRCGVCDNSNVYVVLWVTEPPSWLWRHPRFRQEWHDLYGLDIVHDNAA